MINETILKAQIELYQKGQQQAIMALEKAKAQLAHFGGAIDACQHLLELDGKLTEAQAAKAGASEPPAG